MSKTSGIDAVISSIPDRLEFVWCHRSCCCFVREIRDGYFRVKMSIPELRESTIPRVDARKRKETPHGQNSPD